MQDISSLWYQFSFALYHAPKTQWLKTATIVFACDLWIGRTVLLVWADSPDIHLLVVRLGWMVCDGLAHMCGDGQAGCL